MIARGMKRCPKCGETKPAELFSKNRTKPDGWRAWCKACMASKTRAWTANNRERKSATAKVYNRATPLAKLWRLARWRAKKTGIPFTLPFWKDMVVETRCPLCRKAFVDGVGTGATQLQSRTFDQIFPGRGYTPENVQQICKQCNDAKSHFDVTTNTVGFVKWAMRVERSQRNALINTPSTKKKGRQSKP